MNKIYKTQIHPPLPSLALFSHFSNSHDIISNLYVDKISVEIQDPFIPELRISL
jgi:hypothetical protein